MAAVKAVRGLGASTENAFPILVSVFWCCSSASRAPAATASPLAGTRPEHVRVEQRDRRSVGPCCAATDLADVSRHGAALLRGIRRRLGPICQSLSSLHAPLHLQRQISLGERAPRTPSVPPPRNAYVAVRLTFSFRLFISPELTLREASFSHDLFCKFVSVARDGCKPCVCGIPGSEL